MKRRTQNRNPRKIRNPKHEIRNNYRSSKEQKVRNFAVSVIRLRLQKFEFVSDFAFRDFELIYRTAAACRTGDADLMARNFEITSGIISSALSTSASVL